MKASLSSIICVLALCGSLAFGQSQSEMTQQAAHSAEKADADLNKVYQKLMASLDGDGIKLLKEAQRAWIAYRDAEAKRAGDEARGGSMSPMLFYAATAELTKERTKHLKESLAQRAPSVDLIAGPDSYRRMPELLVAARTGLQLDIKLDKAEVYEGLSGAVGGDGVSGFVTIQRGCDKFCTFCVVPFTRGRERGASPREVLRQVRELAEAGYREVVLLGQTVNSYRYEDVTFAQLLRAVAQVDGIERVRFTSPYPVDFTADVIAAIAEEPKICKYVHLPVQSGSDAVLERMKRGYTVADYRAIVRDLRAAMPQIALSTDILSGFSGETDDDHRATLDLMREIRFDSSFMFAYSERDLTFAAKKLRDDVSPQHKQQRLAEIVKLQETISLDVFLAHVGRAERVLVHGPSKRDPAQLMGRTDGFKTVILPAGLGSVGALVDVTISRATMATLFAT